MNTTENLTPEQQQEHFILCFVDWFDDNFKRIAKDQYKDINDWTRTDNKTVLRTAAECLNLFRKKNIPAPPFVSIDTEKKLLFLAEDAAKKNNALLAGYLKIQRLLQKSDSPTKQELTDIILETMSQITNP